MRVHLPDSDGICVQQTISKKISTDRKEELHDILTELGFEFRQLAHAHWQARGDGAVVSFYKSGKLVIQGKRATGIAETLQIIKDHHGDTAQPSSAERKPSQSSAQGPYADAIAKQPSPRPSRWIGIDEAGKGDYFGPLVTSAALVTSEQLGWLYELGIGDSKRIPDGRILKLDHLLRKPIPHDTVMLMPETYNRLYGKMNNLNRLLAWAHATAAADVLEKEPAELIISDQFSKSSLVQDALEQKDVTTRFTQRTRAEDDPAVAVASIFARAAFLRGIRSLSRQASVKLPLGANSPVIGAGKKLVAKHGEDALEEYAKTHFKTTKKVLAGR